MADNCTHVDEYQRARHRGTTQEHRSGDHPSVGHTAAGPAGMYSLSMLSLTRGAAVRGNGPTRSAAIQSAQQTHGNRAVQRYMQRAAVPSTSVVSVQRSLLDGIDAGLSSVLQWMKGTAGFEQMAAGGFKEKDAPDKVILPPQMVEGMQKGWDKSFPGGKSQEQGGILVKNAKGEYEWKAGSPGTSGTFSPNYGDAKSGESIVGLGHTHPYDKSEGSHTDVPFSDQDLARMVVSPEEFTMVQSGKSQYMAARTKEFDDKVKGLDDKGKQQMMDEMKKEYNKVFASTKGKLPDKAQAAAKAVAQKYNIAYYAGEGGDLSKQ